VTRGAGIRRGAANLPLKRALRPDVPEPFPRGETTMADKSKGVDGKKKRKKKPPELKESKKR
jgi:hypothetical protein